MARSHLGRLVLAVDGRPQFLPVGGLSTWLLGWPHSLAAGFPPPANDPRDPGERYRVVYDPALEHTHALAILD